MPNTIGKQSAREEALKTYQAATAHPSPLTSARAKPGTDEHRKLAATVRDETAKRALAARQATATQPAPAPAPAPADEPHERESLGPVDVASEPA